MEKTANSKVYLCRDGSIKKYLNGKLHCDYGPAVEYPDGYRSWYLDGKLHREDGPAVEYPDGYKAWWVNGKFHRKDGPAVECPDGYKAWWVNGKLHREDEYIKKVQTMTKAKNLTYENIEIGDWLICKDKDEIEQKFGKDAAKYLSIPRRVTAKISGVHQDSVDSVEFDNLGDNPDSPPHTQMSWTIDNGQETATYLPFNNDGVQKSQFRPVWPIIFLKRIKKACNIGGNWYQVLNSSCNNLLPEHLRKFQVPCNGIATLLRASHKSYSGQSIWLKNNSGGYWLASKSDLKLAVRKAKKYEKEETKMETKKTKDFEFKLVDDRLKNLETRIGDVEFAIVNENQPKDQMDPSDLEHSMVLDLPPEIAEWAKQAKIGVEDMLELSKELVKIRSETIRAVAKTEYESATEIENAWAEVEQRDREIEKAKHDKELKTSESVHMRTAQTEISKLRHDTVKVACRWFSSMALLAYIAHLVSMMM